MAIFRQVHVTFWQDEMVIDLTPEQKYFYLYLMTNEKTTQIGVYRITKKVMAFELGYDPSTVDKLLKIFVENGRILYNEENQEILLCNWLKFNKANSPKVAKLLDKQIAEIKTPHFKNVVVTLCIQYQYPIHTEPQQEQEEEQEEKQEREEKEEVFSSSQSASKVERPKPENPSHSLLTTPDEQYLPPNMMIANGIVRSMINKGLCTDQQLNYFGGYFETLLKLGFDEELIRYVVFEKTKSVKRPNTKYYDKIFDEFEDKGQFTLEEAKQKPSPQAAKKETDPSESIALWD